MTPLSCVAWLVNFLVLGMHRPLSACHPARAPKNAGLTPHALCLCPEGPLTCQAPPDRQPH